MNKLVYLLLTILALLLGPPLLCDAQEISKYEIVPSTERYEVTLSWISAAAKKTALTKMAMTRLGDQTGQTDSASITNSGYVFPSAKQRFNRYVKGTIGPFSLFRSAASAGLHQWDNSPLEWGQGMEGYGKRFVSTVGSNAIRQTVTYGISEAFKLDTGFEKSKHTRSGRDLRTHLFRPSLRELEVVNACYRRRSLSVPMQAQSSRMRPGIHRI